MFHFLQNLLNQFLNKLQLDIYHNSLEVLVTSTAYSITKRITTFGNGYLGSCDDEERSEMRYVMRIAERESSNL